MTNFLKRLVISYSEHLIEAVAFIWSLTRKIIPLKWTSSTVHTVGPGSRKYRLSSSSDSCVLVDDAKPTARRHRCLECFRALTYLANEHEGRYILAHQIILFWGQHFHIVPELKEDDGSFETVTPSS